MVADVAAVVVDVTVCFYLPIALPKLFIIIIVITIIIIVVAIPVATYSPLLFYDRYHYYHPILSLLHSLYCTVL